MRTLTLEDEMPASARRLWLAGEKYGWKVWATYASVDAGWNGKPCQSVAVRLNRKGEPGEPPQRIVGVWENGAFSCGLRQSPFGRLNSRELVAAVTG